MGKMHGIAGDGAPMPGFDDGMVDMAGPIRAMAESPVNEAMGARADGAREGGNQRNGYRVRKLVTSIGNINLRIPKLRAGSYFPENLIERYSRVDRAVIAAVSEMVTNGVSTGRVKCVARSSSSSSARPACRASRRPCSPSAAPSPWGSPADSPPPG